MPGRYTIKRDVLRSMAPNGLFAHCALLQALEDARLGPADVSNTDTGLYAASGGSPMLTHHHHERHGKVGVMRCSPMGIVASIVGTLNFNLVAAFKIQGASCGFSSACASSAHALAYAFDDISLGRQKRMFIAGGEDGNRDAILPVCGHEDPLASDGPGLASRPFDVGPGRLCRDRRRGSRSPGERGGGPTPGYPPLWRNPGWGQASDGYNVAISHPEGSGFKDCDGERLQVRAHKAAEVDYVQRPCHLDPDR